VYAELRGEPDHAGTTTRAERRDAVAAAARLMVAADELGASESFVVTTTRILAEPNALTTVPALVQLWLDASVRSPAALDAWRAGIETAAAELAEASGVSIGLTTASRSDGVEFDPELRAALARAAAGQGVPAPEVVCFAGHDAGILAERLPAAMVLVRNATGVSHAPGEHVELEDAAAAANVMLSALEEQA
jgi:N-carbamoyl-L-amino-acid hydrolase